MKDSGQHIRAGRRKSKHICSYPLGDKGFRLTPKDRGLVDDEAIKNWTELSALKMSEPSIR